MPQPGADFYKDSDGQFRWRVIAKNGTDILGGSGEGYHNRKDAIKGLLALVDSINVDEIRQLSEEGE